MEIISLPGPPVVRLSPALPPENLSCCHLVFIARPMDLDLDLAPPCCWYGPRLLDRVLMAAPRPPLLPTEAARLLLLDLAPPCC